MPQYNPPLRDMQFVLHEVLGAVDELKADAAHADIDADTLNAVLEEAGKFAAEVTRRSTAAATPRAACSTRPPTRCARPRASRRPMPVRGRRLAGAELRPRVRRPGPAHGAEPVPVRDDELGQPGLDHVPGPEPRRLRGLHAHGTPEQKAHLYLPKLTSGEWTGTMCLTEPHCGTDLGLLRSKAEPQADGSYRITGQKIFISAGEHDLAANIVHLVLARLPDAPAGSKGISLFVVPKFQVNADGSAGRAQRHLLRRAGAQDGHPRQRHLPDEPGRRRGHAGGPAAQGPGGDVRDDERRPPGRGQPEPGPDRGGLPERRGLREGPHPDAQRCRARRRPTSRPTRSSCTPTCARCC
jgi:hypothetical protein